jgi:SpoVK/Ycf46/Vps4 family AAA+-type ATPase
MTQNSLLAKVEHARLFGDNVDFFKNYHAVLGIRNILKTIGVKNSHDFDWFRALAEYITQDELASLYDKILPQSTRNNLSSSRNHRTPPELNEDDPEEVVSYLSKNPIFRRKMWKLMEVIFQRRVDEYKEKLQDEKRQKSAVELRFAEMKELFNLNDKELNLIVAVFLAESGFTEYGDFAINRYKSCEKISALANILGILDVEVAALLEENNNISKYGLVNKNLELERTFLSYLSGISSKPLAERFWVKYTGEVLPWEFHGKLAEQNGQVLKRMITSKNKNSGLSAILYGVPGSGKTSFAVSLAADLGKEIYFIAQNDESNRSMTYTPAFRYAALAVAQKQLDSEKSILVIDECDKLVENTSLGGSFFAHLFGNDIAGSRDGESKGQLNNCLDCNKHVILWICNSKQEAIDPSSRRRFDYNIFFDDLSTTARCHIWENALKFYNCEDKIDQEFIRNISSRYQVNPGGISLAVKNAALICQKDKNGDFAKEIMVFLKAHCALLGIQESPKELNEPAQDYSLEGLNIKSGIKLPRLIDACKKYLDSTANLKGNPDIPRMNLLLFGVPGAGKTEFVKYLAKQLDKPLRIINASNLLNKFVGGTEQRIAAAFAEAEINNEILFLDEGDSLLGSRESANRTWEVSQVNTLLAEMERFRGIFIVGTNLIQKLDNAALRRFSFRLHFDT